MRGFKREMPKSLEFEGHFQKIKKFQKEQQTIRLELMKFTNYHCSYCDCKLHLTEYTPEIEHFIPKNKRKSFERVWSNLFIACPKCNKNKLGKYCELKPLKPDSLNYDFDKWFKINFEEGKLEPFPKLSQKIKKRVEFTIEWLDLNNILLCEARKNELENYKYNTNPNKNIMDFSYPYFLERAIN